jgi:hypothetical protein
MNDAQQIAELQALKARVDRLTTQGNDQARRIAELEKAGSSVQLARIADALNQFGVLQSVLIQNQTTVKQPASPWRPV